LAAGKDAADVKKTHENKVDYSTAPYRPGPGIPVRIYNRWTVRNIAREIEVVLFDVGGVLVEMKGVPTMLAWLDHKISVEKLWRLWLSSTAVREFETGRIEPSDFADQIIREMRLPVSDEEFLSAFRGWLEGLYPGALELVYSVPERFRRATLCNTSVLHWPRLMSDFELEHAFHHHFASHMTGRIKPDEDAFQHVVDTLGCKSSAIFFLDDNRLNVEAARKIGMRAVQVQGPTEARYALTEAGVLGSGI
jgi:glucose-1-phosphatase